MKILYLPINIDIPEFDLSKLNSSNTKNGKYQPFWKTVGVDHLQIPEITYIVNQLPFSTVTNIYFKEQIKTVQAHVDVHADMTFREGEYQHILEHEPVGYRIVLQGGNDKVYVKCNREFKQAYLPNVPCCYLINSTTAVHKVYNDPNRKTLYFRGFVDSSKHQALIDNNLLIYKDFAIVEE